MSGSIKPHRPVSPAARTHHCPSQGQEQLERHARGAEEAGRRVVRSGVGPAQGMDQPDAGALEGSPATRGSCSRSVLAEGTWNRTAGRSGDGNWIFMLAGAANTRRATITDDESARTGKGVRSDDFPNLHPCTRPLLHGRPLSLLPTRLNSWSSRGPSNRTALSGGATRSRAGSSRPSPRRRGGAREPAVGANFRSTGRAGPAKSRRARDDRGRGP